MIQNPGENGCQPEIFQIEGRYRKDRKEHERVANRRTDGRRPENLGPTDETVSDGVEFNSLITQAEKNLGGGKIEAALGDGGYDRREIFNYLKEKGIQPIIKTRSNACTKSNGSPLRSDAVREAREIGYQAWKEKHRYGRRWTTETTFSAVKRIAGEYVSASKPENMLHEAKLKFVFYNILLNLA